MILHILLLTCSLGRAQTNTEYNFRQQSLLDGDSYGPGDPVPVVTMDCLAANGFGQWTMSATANGAYTAGWYLLENALRKPSVKYDASDLTDHPDCIPPGVVSYGSLSATPNSAVKVATNLAGTVVYVWPSADRTGFVVNTIYESQIDISLYGIPNPSVTRQIVSGSTSASTVSTLAGGNLHNIYSDADPRDDYEIACDETYLYITWCSTTNLSSGVSPIEVWVTAVPLTAGPTPTGFPMSLGQGLRPTVASDPRYNDGGSGPLFDDAYITAASGGAIGSICYSGGASSVNTLQLIINNPDYPTTGPTTYATFNPTHVRALMSSIRGSSAYTHAVYAIEQFNAVGGAAPIGSPELVLYKPIIPGGTMPGTYVDGALLSSPSPIPPAASGFVPYVLDKPIIAFSDPYDNQSGTYDEFHCLYQLHVQPAGYPFLPPPVNPLCIVRGFNNGASSPGGTTDLRLCLNQNIPSGGGSATLLIDPATYVGAVNQMGIHVHWRTEAEGLHYYARDMKRTFDEPIDERTLVTDVCQVTDGTAHGGTVGATILGNGQMTLWTDPNYGEPSTDPSTGTYLPRQGATADVGQVGRLQFIGSNVQLVVGDGSYTTSEAGRYYSSATLTVPPYFYFDFIGTVPDVDASDYANFMDGQGVTVMSNSVFSYYGLNETLGSSPVFMTPFTDGTSVNWGAGTIALSGTYGEPPAYLKIHGGANFYTGPQVALTSNNGEIDVLNEPSITPLNTSAVNGSVTGTMTLLGYTYLSNSALVGNIPGPAPTEGSSLAPYTIMTVDAALSGSFGGDDITSYQFDAENSTFTNSDPTGVPYLMFGHGSNTSGPYFWDVMFNGGSLNYGRIVVADPLSEMTVQDMGFEMLGGFTPLLDEADFYDNCIYIYNDQDPTTSPYGSITITGNYLYPIMGSGTTLDPESLGGICITGFDGVASGPSTEDHSYGTITVSSNQFGAASGIQNSCAIIFRNTTGNIVANKIISGGWQTGVNLYAEVFGISTPLTYSLLCSNDIENIANTCVNSSHYRGILKLNKLGASNINYGSDFLDHSFLIFDSLLDYVAAGIFVDHTGSVDLSGIHSPADVSGADDYSAKNTIYGPANCSAIAPIVLGESCDASVVLGNSEAMWSWSHYGENNIFVTSPTGECAPRIISGCISTSVNLLDIDNNFWGTSISPPITSSGSCPCNWNSADALETDAVNVGFAESSSALTSMSAFSGITCGGGTGYNADKDRHRNARQAAPDSVPTGCQLLYNKGIGYEANFDWQQCYDTCKKFIETCPLYYQSWRAFSSMSDAVQNLSPSDTALFSQFRSWLESVLYLNTVDPEYFCACVEAISGTFHFPDTAAGDISRETNYPLALLQWLIQNTECDTPVLAQQFQGGRDAQIGFWERDTAAYPLDTTLPTMKQLGLDSILKLHNQQGVVQPAIYASDLQSFSLSDNPFSASTMLRCNLSKAAYIRTEVYDELGRTIIGDGTGRVYDPGLHQQQLDLSKFASGAYYLRISAGDGETRTIKMVRRE